MVDPKITVESAKIAVVGVVAISMLLGVAGVVILAAARRRRCFLVFSALAGLPLIAGAVGMAMGYREVVEKMAALGASGIDSPAVHAAFAQARMPLYIGAGGFAALLLVSLVGLLLCKDLCERKDLEATELVK